MKKESDILTVHNLIRSRPSVEDYDLKPYGYIVALNNYIEKLENHLESLDII